MGSQRENEAIAGLLRQRLAREDAGSACLEPETLAAYFEHSLEASEAKVCDLHLSKCARCREQLVVLARSAEGEEGRAHESRPQFAWLFDWRWLTAAAGAMALATMWFVHERGVVTPIKSPANLPTVAMNRPEPKPEAGVGGAPVYDAKQAPAKAFSREAGSPKEIAGMRKDAPLAAKKRAPIPPVAESVTVVGPPSPSPLQSRQTESDTAANQIGVTPSNEELKQSVQKAQRARAADAGHFGSNQQVQTSQAVMGTMQSQSELSAQRRSAPTQVGGAQTGYAAGVGGGSEEAKAKVRQKAAPAAAPTTSAAQPSETSEASANAKADAAAGVNGAADKVAKDVRASAASAQLNADDREALQIVEQRSAEKVINTPNPAVKWRITSSGFVERTDDSGATWNGQAVDASGGLLAGSAPDEKTCWVVGRQGQVFVTKDGQQWKQTSSPVSGDLVSVSAKDASSATVMAADGSRFSTRNSGRKWKPEGKEGAANSPQQP